ncbi:FtsX-like permease family protein [Candidatus Bathycorpusculum sp.]|uniref:FtsX-like permease family protein n=1 Tax=Candidatus Bathycorpusculum sp. TaxID=2994959 RepID=UPI002822FAD5|nr:FtsX-like permease family protein [Candidatus Termitimicrobium sp.]
MVGVGFYAGLQITAPNVIAVADNYYKDHALMDFKIISSMGLTDADVEALKHLDGVADVIPSYSLDAQSRGSALRIHAIEKNVNTLRLTEGKMPSSDMECVADNRNYKIGDIIEITDDVDDNLKNTEFTVVGLVESVLYLSEDYGSTTVGNGKLSSFIFINKDNFVLDIYVEIYVILKTTSDVVAYSDQYTDLISKFNDELNEIKPDRETARYSEIYNEAMEIIEEKEAELNSEKAKAEKEFNTAKKELDENSQKLNEAKSVIAKNERSLDDTIKTQTAEFDFAKQRISDGWDEINFALSEVGITQDDLSSKIDVLDSVISDLKTQLVSLPGGSSSYVALTVVIAEYSETLEGLRQLKSSIDTLNTQETQLNDGIAVFNAEIEQAKNEIGKAKNEITVNEQKIVEGYHEYYTNLAKFNVEIADAIKQIEDSKTELSDIDRPVWYISDRKSVVGYAELDSSIQIVAVISTIFPFFFILISILMTSNSMARMITEERGELGTLASLGYNDTRIISTYLLYVLSASGLGAAIGFFIGCRVIPPLIWENFVFIFPPLVLQYNWVTFGIILAVTFVLMSFVTIVACNRELNQMPASLLRPLPPKHGQQIFIEKIAFIWRRFSFTWKITMRNMFRYKKRAFMTIVGVAGCASLLLVAFGVHDGMGGIVQKQYGDIMQYDNMIILKDDTQTMNGELKTLLDEQQIEDPLLIKQSAYKIDIDQKSLDFFLIVPQTNVLFEKYFNLKSPINGRDIVLNDGDVIITQRIAAVYGLSNGDVFTIKDADNNFYDLIVTDVAENYVSNYVYISAPTYAELFGDSVTFNAIVSNHEAQEETKLAENLIDSGFVVTVIFSNDAVEKAHDNLNNLNGVIILILIVASILAVVVLYNLTAINISERTREIATLKVLGFRDGETNAYIYREAFILTGISIGVGMVLGIILHSFVMNIVEINAISLYRNIGWLSFVLSCIITLMFSVFMQIITYFKLKKIDMIESLKSTE